jgi:tetratricopeptide (TPR) repeat protein
MPSDTSNTVHSPNVGAVVQAGVVHGSIHLHSRPPDRPAIPHQLPMRPRGFVARDRELARLNATLEASAAADDTVVVVVEGTGGVGKTTLVLHWAHRNVARFPDGQLYTNLRGFDPAGFPVEPHTVLRGFLATLGIDSAAVPADPDAAAALYRSVLAGRRMMIVLDNAKDIDQVVPLLPGTSSCAVVVTTRHHLPGLRMRGASFVRLGTLADEDARMLLLRHMSRDAIDREPAAVSTVLECCAGLPLALAIVAARTADHPEFPISHVADELQEETSGLNAFDAGDESANLRAVLSWSTTSLDGEQSRAFQLLGSTPIADIGVTAAACVLAVPPRDAARVLRALETKNLLRQPKPGRFQMHDLVRRHAAELAAERSPLSARLAALQRLVTFYAHTARAADHLLYPHRFAGNPPELIEGCHPAPLADEPAALAWFAEEHHQLLAVQRSAVREAWSEPVWHISHALDTYQYRVGLLTENIASSRLGLDAADTIGSPRLRASALRQLGRAYTRAGQLEDAERRLWQALQLEIEAGSSMGSAHTHHDLQRVYSLRGEHDLALQHATSALELYQMVGNPVGEAHSLNAQGRQHAQLRRYDDARRCCESALALHIAHANPSGQIATLDALGFIAQQTGQLNVALSQYSQAFALAQESGNRFAEADIIERLADVYTAQGEDVKALQAARSAHDLFAAQHRLRDAERLRDRLAAATTPPAEDPR